TVRADDGLRQLRQPDGQVDVGSGVVNPPSAAIAPRVVAERHAAEVEAAVEALGCGQPHERAATLPELSRAQGGSGRERRPEHERRDDTRAARHGTHSIIRRRLRRLRYEIELTTFGRVVARAEPGSAASP